MVAKNMADFLQIRRLAAIVYHLGYMIMNNILMIRMASLSPYFIRSRS